MCCDNDFKINHGIHIHGHSMSSLYSLRDYDPVLLRPTGYNHKIYRPRMQVYEKEVGGRVKVSLNLYRTVSKFCSIECLICCFSDELKMKIG